MSYSKILSYFNQTLGLLEAKEAALANPLEFVEKLQRGEKQNFPEPQKVATIPDIEWEKYHVAAEGHTSKPGTRNRAAVNWTPTPTDEIKLEKGDILVKVDEISFLETLILSLF